MTTTVLTERSPVRWRLRRSTGLIGVDIGARFAKLAQVRRRGGHWVISAVHSLPLSGEPFADDETVPVSVLGEALQHISLRDAGFRGPRCAAVLSGAVVESRTLQLPDTSVADLEHMVSLELEADSRDSDTTDQRQFDLWTSPGEGGLNRVSVLSVDEAVARDCVHNLQLNGLHCEAIDGLPFALARAVQMVDPSSVQRTVAALDWGCHEPLLTVLQGGLPVYQRPLRDCGLDRVTAALCDDLDLTPFEASRLLGSVGFVRRDVSHDSDGRRPAASIRAVQQAVSRALNPVFERLHSEVSRTLDYLEQQISQPAVSELWLFGGGATLPDIATVFTARLQRPCRVWQPAASQIAATIPATAPLAAFGAAVGLSLLADEV